MWCVGELPGDLLFKLDGVGALPGIDGAPRSSELVLERLDLLVELAHSACIAGECGQALRGPRRVELIFVRQPGVLHDLQVRRRCMLAGVALLEDPGDALGNEDDTVGVGRMRASRRPQPCGVVSPDPGHHLVFEELARDGHHTHRVSRLRHPYGVPPLAHAVQPQ